MRDSISDPKISIEKYIEPHVDRSTIASENMPSDLLKKDEISDLIKNCPEHILLESANHNLIKSDSNSISRDINNNFINAIPTISENAKKFLNLRETDKISISKQQYIRH